ncbi:MAG: hypothetical protein OEV94_12180 [Deltaproteobacteria bacterium]|nr:hypothetical protein [Deltaproteobacteria bacterium]
MDQPPQQIVELTIERMGAKAMGLARLNGKRVLVARGLPGETLRAELAREQPDYLTALALEPVVPSPQRVEPACPHFAQCGGCDWQHLAYPAQLEAKRQTAEETFRRQGGLEPPPGWILHPCPRPLEYRDRLTFAAVPVSPGTGPAALVPGFFPWKEGPPVAVEVCRLAPEVLTRLAAQALAWPPLAGLNPAALQVETVLHGPPQAPRLGLVLRVNQTALLQALAHQGDSLTAWLDAPWDGIPHPPVDQVALLADNGKGEARLLRGDGRLEKHLGPHRWMAPLGGFFQVNPTMAEALVGRLSEHLAEPWVQHLAGPNTGKHKKTKQNSGAGTKHPSLMDLYCGAGLLSLPLARQGWAVTGVEQNQEAAALAQTQSTTEGLKQARFVGANLETPGELTRQAARHQKAFGPPTVLLADPPRRGLSAQVVREIMALGPPVVVLVSCDGATLARDAARLSTAYGLASLEGFDLFPQTHHLEFLAVLKRK